MKNSRFLLFLLLGAVPTQAQIPPINRDGAPAVAPASRAEDAAKPVEFGFNSDFDQLQNHLTWTQISDDGKGSNLFFSADSSDKGVPIEERIAFFDTGNRLLSTLIVSFDEDGKIASYGMTDAADKPLVVANLDAKLLKVNGSAISVETTANKGLLQKRVFTLNYPTWKGTLTSDYDKQGRRARDVFASSTSDKPDRVSYSYDKRGLSQVKAVTGENDEFRVEMERDKTGNNIRTRISYNGELNSASTPVRDKAGQVTGSRTENYKGGELSDIVELSTQKEGAIVSITLTQMDSKGMIQQRRIQNDGRTIYAEEFEKGRLRQRVDFDGDETPTFVTLYKEDGSVEWKKAVGPDGKLIDEEPAKN